MKNFKILAILLIFILISCGRGDKQTQLAELEKQRDELNEQIERLKAEIGTQDGTVQFEGKTAYVRVMEVNPGLFKHHIKVQGTIESDNNIFVPPQAPGVVRRIYVNEGDQVTKGQLLAELDGAVYEKTIAEIESGLELATTIFERQERLWNKKIGSEIAYLQAKSNKESLEKRLETVNEQYRMTKITTPISGTVDQIMIKEGEAAAAGFGAIRIVQLTDLKIEAFLSDNYISQIKKDDAVGVYIPVLEKEFELTIAAVSQVIDPKNRTFGIEIKIPGSESEIKPNMLAVLTINDYSNPEAITVPINVVQKTNGEQFLFTATKEGDKLTAHKRVVKTGKYYGEKIEITEGITQGENVVVFGFQDLADGQNIALDMNNN